MVDLSIQSKMHIAFILRMMDLIQSQNQEKTELNFGIKSKNTLNRISSMNIKSTNKLFTVKKDRKQTTIFELKQNSK